MMSKIFAMSNGMTFSFNYVMLQENLYTRVKFREGDITYHSLSY